MDMIAILEKQKYAMSSEYRSRLIGLEDMMSFWPDEKKYKQEYVDLVQTYGSRTPQSYALLQSLEKEEERAIMSSKHLDNGIAQSTEEPPCTEGGNDMAKRHKVCISLPDGTSVHVTGATEKELVTNAINRFAFGYGVKDKDMPTIEDYAKKWYEVTWKPKEGNGKNTAANVYTYIHTHIIPRFGEKRLNEIKRSDVQAYANDLQTQGKAESTIDKIMICLGKIFEMAVDDGQIHTNPVKKIDKGNKRTERLPLTAEELSDVITNMKNLRTSDMLLVAIPLFAGTRRGETLALQWKDINWNAHTITINKAIHNTGKPRRPMIGDTKSRSGNRIVPLLPQLEALLKPLEGQPEQYIIGVDKLFTESAYNRAWQRIEKTIDMHGATAHSLRHTFATFAVDKTDVKTLQYIMGHSEISTTMDVYAHARPDKVTGLYVNMASMYNSSKKGQLTGHEPKPATPYVTIV